MACSGVPISGGREGGGASGPRPHRQSTGGHICCQLDQNGPHGPVWAMTENRPNLRQVICHFPGASETYQGPTGQIGAQKDESGPGRRIRACETNQGLRDESGPAGHGPAGGIRASETGHGLAGRTRDPRDEYGPCKTDKDTTG